MESSPAEAAAEFARRVVALDSLLDHRVRLAVCVLLSRHDRLSFSQLKAMTAETDGSLGAHLRKLEDEGFLRIRKEFVGRKPTTWYSLSPKGMSALAAHLQALTGLLAGTGV